MFTAIALGVVIYIARTARNLRSVGWAITLGLLLGGAMGNLADRIFRAPGLFRGNVVDWIELTRYWPVFNLADSAIVCGGILTVLLAMFGYHFDGTRGTTAAMPPPARRAPTPPSTLASRQTAGTAGADRRAVTERISSWSPRGWTGSGWTRRWPGCSACPGRARPS